MNTKKLTSSAVLTVLIITGFASNAHAISEGNRIALQEIRTTAKELCLIANDYNASRQDIEVAGEVKVGSLINKLFTLDGIKVNGSYKKSTQKGILVDEITDDLVALDIIGGARCTLEIFRELKDELIVSENKGGKGVQQFS